MLPLQLPYPFAPPAAAAAAAIDVAQSESATVADSQVAVGTFAHGVAETGTVSHSQITSLAAGAAQAESATVSHIQSSTGSFGHAVAESATVSESSSTDGAVLVSCSEAATVSESYASTGSFGHAAAESLNVGEVGTATAVWASSVAESATISDDYALVGTIFDVSIAQSVSVNESSSAARQCIGQATESGSLGELLGILLSIAAVRIETATVAEAVSTDGLPPSMPPTDAVALLWSSAQRDVILRVQPAAGDVSRRRPIISAM
jgi:hypothetical protein